MHLMIDLSSFLTVNICLWTSCFVILSWKPANVLKQIRFAVPSGSIGYLAKIKCMYFMTITLSLL